MWPWWLIPLALALGVGGGFEIGLLLERWRWTRLTGIHDGRFTIFDMVRAGARIDYSECLPYRIHWQGRTFVACQEGARDSD